LSLTRLEKHSTDKHSSLFVEGISDEEVNITKRFSFEGISDEEVNITKRFSFSQSLPTQKLGLKISVCYKFRKAW